MRGSCSPRADRGCGGRRRARFHVTESDVPCHVADEPLAWLPPRACLPAGRSWRRISTRPVDVRLAQKQRNSLRSRHRGDPGPDRMESAPSRRRQSRADSSMRNLGPDPLYVANEAVSLALWRRRTSPVALEILRQDLPAAGRPGRQPGEPHRPRWAKGNVRSRHPLKAPSASPAFLDSSPANNFPASG